jgi:serine/threonine protein kinase
LPEDLQILEWEVVARGTHGTIRRVKIRYQGSEKVVCVKLFGEEWKAGYEREANSYALMAYRGIRRCIPHVYWKGEFPVSRWNGDDTTDDLYEIQYGLVMEWFDDYRQVDYSLLDIPTALAIGRALDRVHAARIKHGDLQGQNILLVRENGAARVVLIDFSCAWLNCHHYTVDDEYDSFLGTLLDEMVFLVLLNSDLPRIPKNSHRKYLKGSLIDLCRVLTAKNRPPPLTMRA